MQTALKKARTVGRHAVLIFVCFLFVFPLYWMLMSSFKGQGEIFSASFWPQAFTLENYVYAFSNMPIWQMLKNSFFIAIFQTAFQLVTGVLAAYALSRFQFRGKAFVFGLFSLTWLIPVQSIMIPNYVTIIGWGLKNNPIAVILPYAASAFAILNLYQTFESFPHALIEASKMDGDNEVQTLLRIVLPNLKASMASLGILLFINSWNEYLWPMLVMSKMESAPIQIGLRAFTGSDVNMWGSMMAATTVSCLPILLIYIVLQRHIVDSFVKWGIK